MRTSFLKDFLTFRFPENTIYLITVYKNPKDFPGKYIARLFEMENPTSYAIQGDSLDEIREKIPSTLRRIPRSAKDDPVIVEVWL